MRTKVTAVILLAMLCLSLVTGAPAARGPAVYVKGQRIAAQAVVRDGVVYLPARAVGDALGVSVEWDAKAGAVYVAGRPSQQAQTYTAKPLPTYTAKALPTYTAKALPTYTAKAVPTYQLYQPKLQAVLPAREIQVVLPAPKIQAVLPAPKIQAVLPAPKIQAVLPAPKIQAVLPAPTVQTVLPPPKVETILPAPTVPTAPPAPTAPTAALLQGPPKNGTDLAPPRGSSGRGWLEITNGTEHDAIVKLVAQTDATDPVSPSSVVLHRSVYVSAHNSVKLERIDPGQYRVLFCTGRDWDAGANSFHEEYSTRLFERALVFAEQRTATGVSYKSFRLTLHGVPGGTAVTDFLAKKTFDAIR